MTAKVARHNRAGWKKVFRETASGAKTDGAKLRKALAVLEDNDVPMVNRPDCLAGSSLALLNTLAAITDRKAGFRSQGRARVVARRVRMGQPPKLALHQMKESLTRPDKGNSMREIARPFDVSNGAISRLVS